MTTDGAKRRDPVRTKEALLVAARDLFGEQGYDRTTLRNIGDRAGVDPALVARYFGSKAGLYIATLEELPDDRGAARPVFDDDRVEDMIERATRIGANPMMRAAVAASDDPAVVDAARRIFAERLIGPICERLAAAGLDRPRLRAELTTAMLMGIMLARSTGTLTALASASTADVVDLTLNAVHGVLDD